MKKIILILISLIAVLGCSSNDESSKIVETPENLIGSWKFVGYYTLYDIDQEPGANYNPVENGGITTYYANNSFNYTEESINYTGNYSVTADSILTLNYNQSTSNDPVGGGSSKITLLTNTVLEKTCLSGGDCETYRFEKINQ